MRKIATLLVWLAISAVLSAQQGAPPAPPARGGQPPGPPARGGQPPGPQQPGSVDIVINGKVARQLSVDAIRKAATTRIDRFGMMFDATPFEAVLKLAAIAPTSRVRVTGEEDVMMLERGGADDPAAYVVIVNMRGLPVLTPLPGGRVGGPPAAPVGAPGRGSGGPPELPPPGSRGGTVPVPPGPGGGDGRGFPPQGAPPGAGPGRGGNGAGPGTPAGFGELKEVRSVLRIEVLN